MYISKNWSLVNPNKIYPIALIAIMVFSCFLNFLHLKERSLLDWDEAYYLNIVKTWRSGIDWAAYKIFDPKKVASQTLGSYVLEHGGAVNTFAKDGFLTFVFLFSYLVGLHDTTILWASAIFGVFTILLVYFIGKEVFGALTGLLSSGILAVSIYHLHYARSGFPQTTSVFFLYLAVFLYLLSHKHRADNKISRTFLFFSGISLGYGFSCHYNLFWAPPVFFLIEASRKILFAKEISLREYIERIFLLFLGILIPIFFWGMLSGSVKMILYKNPASLQALRGSLGIGSYMTYFERLLDLFRPLFFRETVRDYASSAIMQTDLLFYIKLLFLREGPVMLIFLAFGIIRLIYRQKGQRIFTEFFILTFFLMPLLFWSLYSWQLSRSFVSLIPLTALISASLVVAWIGKIARTDIAKFTSTFAVLLIYLFIAHGKLSEELSYKSGYPQAIRFMKGHLGIKHLSSQYTISRFFAGRNNALDISVSFDKVDIKNKLNNLYADEGYKYLVLDQMRFVFSDSPIVNAAERSRAVFVTHHSTRANLFENWDKDFIKKASFAPQVIEVYELKDIISNM